MKTTRSMLIAFLLNLGFSVFEFFGGIISGSFAIMSDALHDLGDAFSIGISLIFERKSKKAPDEIYTYGYGNFSLIGALFTTLILLFGCVIIIINAISKIINPSEIEYGKMIIFAIIGVLVNTVAAFVTRGKDSANQRAVNLHMLEDVLGWICVLIGAVIMHFTDFYILDPIMSIAVSTFIIFHSMSNLKEIFSVFLGKVPEETDISEIKEHLMLIEGICDVHHIHILKHGSGNILATMHIVTDENSSEIKAKVREELIEHGISHVTLEIEGTNENCNNRVCNISHKSGHSHSHGHCHH
jgi:cobalt-zinc-cadmium efflux system protein